MARSWRDYQASRDNSDNRDISPAADPETAPNVANVTNVTVPAALAQGLERLRSMAVPRGVCPQGWAESVADAGRIAAEGWAAQALALGWSPLDLFGGVTGKADDPHADGLAVWLSGRKLLAITESGAVASDGFNRRDCFSLPRSPGARLLWELGGGR